MKRYIAKFKGLFFINILSIFLFNLVNVAAAFMFQIIVDAGAALDLEKLKEGAIIALIFILAYGLMDFLHNYFQGRLLQKISVALKNDIFQKILGRNIRTFKEQNTARYISTLTNDVKIIEEDYFTNILNISYHFFSFILGIIALTYINPIMTVYVVITAFLPMIAPILLGKKLSAIKKCILMI